MWGAIPESVEAGLLGGEAAKVAGGKFDDGFTTAAVQYLATFKASNEQQTGSPWHQFARVIEGTVVDVYAAIVGQLGAAYAFFQDIGQFGSDLFSGNFGALGGDLGSTLKDLYDGLNPATVSGNLLLASGNLDEIFAQVSSSSTTSYLRDGVNSGVALTSSGGSITGNIYYSPYGDSAESGTGATPFQFTGRENDGATGLYYYRARYYSPQMGRFISEDPIGLLAGPNFYAYASENPISRLDPLGLQPPGTAFAQTFNFYNTQAMQQTAAAYAAYTQNPAWLMGGPNPLTGCFDIACQNVNAYLLSISELPYYLLAPPAIDATAGLVCKVPAKSYFRGLLWSIKAFDKLHGSPDTLETLEQLETPSRIQSILPGGNANPVSLPTPPAQTIGGP